MVRSRATETIAILALLDARISKKVENREPPARDCACRQRSADGPGLFESIISKLEVRSLVLPIASLNRGQRVA
ncbi:hypothetical protein IQ235_06815 [Oscillatoriales cyanobacterium LEGE 11467]|uniref:Uncharacterized protein n=1 Tax=Zarconia navalis LEGE 11467 TaxID=1828826 RepID=A0A928VZG8_9CYAN|nr:hypothetical protein [Zarconia navalis]MBE9040500.1 hypothetical protein [Zarconia navalis LEGE 11467]